MSCVRAMISFCVLVRCSNFDLQISILSYSLITNIVFLDFYNVVLYFFINNWEWF